MPARDRLLSNLYRAHARELRLFARRRVGDQAAEDLVQDAYLHLMQIGEVEHLKSPRPYLFRIVSNLAVDSLRKDRRRGRVPGMETPEADLEARDPGKANENALLARQLWKSLAELPPACQDAFLLQQIFAMNHREIARRLRINVRTVQRHVRKAMEHLQRRMGEFP